MIGRTYMEKGMMVGRGERMMDDLDIEQIEGWLEDQRANSDGPYILIRDRAWWEALLTSLQDWQRNGRKCAAPASSGRSED